MGAAGDGVSPTGLLGGSQRAIVDELVARLDRVVAGEPVERVVLLRGAAGVGKSRIVVEFYERLRARQPTSGARRGYWPVLPNPDRVTFDELGIPQRAALRIGPDPNFDRAPQALPGYFWWWADAADGGPDVILRRLWGQLAVNLPYLTDAWHEVTSASDRLRGQLARVGPRAREEAPELAKEAGLEGLSAFLTALGASVPFSGPAITRVLAMAQKRHAHRVARASRGQGGSPRSPWPGARQVYTELTRVINPRMPLVLVVEDMHRVGPGLAALLDVLAEPSAETPVLVVGTVRPEGIGRDSRFDHWYAAATDPELGAPVATILDVPALGEDDLVRLAGRFAPNADSQLLRPVVRAWPNARAVTVAMMLARVGGELRDGRPVPDAMLASGHDAIAELFAAAWRDLAPDARRALMMAAGTVPDAESGPEVTSPFLTWAVARAAERAGLRPRAEVFAGLRDAAVAHWLVGVDGTRGLSRFADRHRGEIAVRALASTEGPAARPRLLEAARAVLGEWLTSGSGGQRTIDDPVALAAARWLVALTEPGDLPGDMLTAARLVAASQAAFGDQDAALGTLGRFLGSPDWSDPVALSDQHNQATWTWVVGQRERDRAVLDDALQRLERVLQRRDAILGRRDPTTMETRSVLARWWGEVYRYPRSIALYEELIEDRTAVLGPDHPHTQTSRNNLAYAYESVGDLGRAIPLFEQTLADRLRVLGPDHPQTLASRNNLAGAYESVGDLGQAIPLFEQTLADSERVLGPDHPNTLASRDNLAHAKACAAAADPNTALGVRADPPTPNACMDHWLDQPMTELAMFALSGLLTWHSAPALIEAFLSRPPDARPADRYAALRLVEIGFDVHEVRLIAANRWAAERAALAAVKECDNEDVALIVAVNPELTDSARGAALLLLAAVVADEGETLFDQVQAALDEADDFADAVADAVTDLAARLDSADLVPSRLEAVLKALRDRGEG